MVYIGKDLPDEYAHSKYTKILKGTNAKAKANATQGLPEIIEIAQKNIMQIQKKNILKMLNMVGIGISLNLRCRYSAKQEK